MAITFVDATGLYSSVDPGAVPAPIGMANNDILLMAVLTNVTSGVVIWPAGFVDLGSYTPVARSCHLGWKRASNESGTYAIEVSGGGVASSTTLTVYRGVWATGSPFIKISNTPYTTSNTTIRAAGFTVDEPCALAFFGLGYYYTGMTSPSGFTLAEASPNDSYMNESSYKLAQAAGFVPDTDATAGATTADKHAFMVALRHAAPAIVASQDSTHIDVTWS